MKKSNRHNILSHPCLSRNENRGERGGGNRSRSFVLMFSLPLRKETRRRKSSARSSKKFAPDHLSAWDEDKHHARMLACHTVSEMQRYYEQLIASSFFNSSFCFLCFLWASFCLFVACLGVLCGVRLMFVCWLNCCFSCSAAGPIQVCFWSCSLFFIFSLLFNTSALILTLGIVEVQMKMIAKGPNLRHNKQNKTKKNIKSKNRQTNKQTKQTN